MKRLYKLSLFSSVFALAVSAWSATSSDYTLAPLSLTQENTPLVMLAMSNDHQLFMKAYPDFTDLDGDGVLNIRYTDEFSYSGYFNPDLCYEYNDSDDLFEVLPAEEAVGPRADNNTGETIYHSCREGWSGNFLNWVTMTRMDMVRHVLYGGKRVVDDTTPTESSTVAGVEVKHGGAVLQRAYLPNDVHSFAKIKPEYDAIDNPDEVALYHIVPDDYVSSDGVSFCSTSTSGSNPVLRAAKGLYSGWSMNAGTVCNYGESGSPPWGQRINNDLTVRVEACRDPQEWGSSRCRLYLDGDDRYYKPVGLLQKFGEDGRIEFGLITGSYVHNTNGGIIRSPIKRFAGNTTATNDEVNLTNGAIQNVSQGIIKNLDALHIYGWQIGDSRYDGNCFENSYNVKNDRLKSDSSSWSIQCPDWGNPMGEILYETLRYFSGEPNHIYAGNRTRNGTTRDDQYFNGDLSMVRSWTNPLNSDNYCAKCATILISSGPTSFDNDVVNVINGDVAGLDSADDLIAKTNEVGDLEYDTLTGKSFIAKQLNGGIEVCVEKTMGTLSQEVGICPDAPNIEGSFHIAGLAYHANTNDLSTVFAGDQTVDTYAIDLADAVPELDFTVKGSPVKIVPACMAGPNGDYHYCSLTDIQLKDLEISDSGDLIYARMHVAWEDANWGMDYDLDLVQRIDICTNLYTGSTTCQNLNDGEFHIRNQIVNWAGSHYHRASYSISGSSDDGVQQSWSLKTGQGDVVDDDYDWITSGSPPALVTKTYEVDTAGTVAESLKKPLFLAAKYGGFVDANANGKPDLVQEWDSVINETGGFGSDGIPDNYYKVRNPATLEQQLSQVFNSIVERVSSGSNAAVVANRASGNGSIYQALYYPKLSEGTTSVSWVGQIHSLFVDRAGLIREDTDGDMVLDNAPVYNGKDVAPTAGDFIVNIFYDENKQDTFFQRYVLLGATGDAAKVAIPHGVPIPIEAINSIWNGAESLASYSDTEVLNQRTYTDKADTGRYIMTSTLDDCDANGDSVVEEQCETMRSFTSANISELSGYLGFTASESTEALEVISYTRGVDLATLRTRQFDVDGDGSLETWRLGDIIHSTPLVVEKTTGSYDRSLSDDTYEAFRKHYEDRRRMVYVGSNGGMIHAFNGGYWNSVCNGFYDQEIVGSGTGGKIVVANDCKNADNTHPVGAEMWAYVPRAALPTLKWKTEQDYAHIYTVDGEPQAYDVRIFEPSADHVNGWGTILVVPMRQGGLNTEVDHDNDGDANDVQVMRSSIIVLDITNPDSPPELIAEISDENLGLTLSKPTLIYDYQPSAVQADGSGGEYSSPTQNDWYLVFGSGPYPAEPGNAAVSTSSQSGHLYTFDLKSKALVKRKIEDPVDSDKDASTSFLAGFESSDWDGNGTTDAVYFGSVSGPVNNQTGKLFRWRLPDNIAINDSDDLSPATMLESGQPIVAAPITSRDSDGERWVHFGTGRFYVQDDRDTEMQQSVYGIKEPKSSNLFTWSEVSKADLLYSNDIAVLDSGTIMTTTGNTVEINSTEVADYDALLYQMSNKAGWYRNLTKVTDNPSGRSLREPLMYQDQLIFSEYLPSADQCDVNGRSMLNVVSWKTGTAIPYSPLGQSTAEDLDNDGDTENVVSTSADLGVGEFSGVTVFETSDNITLIDDSTIISALIDDPTKASEYAGDSSGNCVFVQSSTGEMVCYRTTVGDVDAAGRQSWRELEILF
ncbi:pilus assembly protein [Reinekea blandensis]|uniref:Uncharacterized protein n=1 Tax=Reinekea blandensis MED297 TaxID=314283 RepID=A4BJK4_9GAMM|nr:PilC/PilY family type IV pilus protein [Reinekea blandensis]EAR07708.1 hypothetical protein MED297_18206 [Reinekea sp. MED297] [Reinekea blandensis MED297]